MKKLTWTYREDRPRETKKFFKKNIPLRFDLEKVAQYLFNVSDNYDTVYAWETLTPCQVTKKITDVIYHHGIAGLVVDDPDCDNDDQWWGQPDFCQKWFIDQAAKLFPELEL